MNPSEDQNKQAARMFARIFNLCKDMQESHEIAVKIYGWRLQKILEVAFGPESIDFLIEMSRLNGMDE